MQQNARARRGSQTIHCCRVVSRPNGRLSWRRCRCVHPSFRRR
jgi:hypothetical protein